MSNTALTNKSSGWAMVPSDPSQALKMAEFMAQSGLVPKDFIGKPNAILVVSAMGEMLGLNPFSSMMGIASINGRPSLWGTVMRGVILASSKFAGLEERLDGEGDERVAVCILSRKGVEKPYEATFSVTQAKKAGLWGGNVWAKYPEDMLKHRAFARAAKSLFADVLSGFESAEEMRDVEVLKEAEVIPRKTDAENVAPARSRKSAKPKKQTANIETESAEVKTEEVESDRAPEAVNDPFVDAPEVVDVDPESENLTDRVIAMDRDELVAYAKEVAKEVGNKKVKIVLFKYTNDEKSKIVDCPSENYNDLYDDLSELLVLHEQEA